MQKRRNTTLEPGDICQIPRSAVSEIVIHGLPSPEYGYVLGGASRRKIPDEGLSFVFLEEVFLHGLDYISYLKILLDGEICLTVCDNHLRYKVIQRHQCSAGVCSCSL